MRNESSTDALLPKEMEMAEGDASKRNSEKQVDFSTGGSFSQAEVGNRLVSEKDDRNKSIPFELYKRRTTVVVRREAFLNVVCEALTEYKYVGPNQRADLVLACR